ncbi:MAG: inorganic phosphate transporter [Candidatus Electryonea clarkiae]|nr:inorganic phosphate transporter [Candidatus Electryonea clarkiae]MDP8289048.1 inorganic phosphate transporter [Candidatus Electryonea clarkiae]
MELLFIAVIILIAFAIFDLVVGVSNDAVNFLNSSFGSRVAPRFVIMIIASLGIIVGVSFSSGMMEVARKGIFNPQFFNMPELMVIFLAVMITDIMLLDLFNTYGLPTSTTVSIVFELLGGAVAVSILKILQSGESLITLSQYINTSKAMMIIFGILLSVVVAFIFGALVQFFSRILFTFDYTKRLKRYGALWGGVALAFITYFILVKGAKGATFIPAETAEWIRNNALLIMFYIFVISAVFLQILLLFKVNILKPIVLIGTFALAMAFAANDLVNFIGVPMAGYHAYNFASASDAPMTMSMGALGKAVPTETFMILIAGLIMVITLWFSKKARTVSETELTLGQQSSEEEDKYESIFLSRAIVRMMIGVFSFVRLLTPPPLVRWISRRMDTTKYKADNDSEQYPSFDLLRASVNMMVASAVISYATSQKLPLSTTYVTFMVSMGTSFADLAWGRDSAVYRITGVLTVIGGWFMTAMLAFTVSGLVAVTIFYAKGYGVGLALAFVAFTLWKNRAKHGEIKKQKEIDQVFNLKKITDVTDSISTTFEHMGLLLHEIRESLDITLNALIYQNVYSLKSEKIKTKRIQRWANIIIANVFKSMRLLQKEDAKISYMYGQTIRRLQKLADGHRDITMRSYMHVNNNHKGLLTVQTEDLKEVKELLDVILIDVETILDNREFEKYETVIENDKRLRELAEHLNQNQIERVQSRESKTRLTILYYSIIGNAMMMSKQNIKLIEIFSEIVKGIEKSTEFDMD